MQLLFFQLHTFPSLGYLHNKLNVKWYQLTFAKVYCLLVAYPFNARLPGSHKQKMPDQPLKKAKSKMNSQRQL